MFYVYKECGIEAKNIKRNEKIKGQEKRSYFLIFGGEKDSLLYHFQVDAHFYILFGGSRSIHMQVVRLMAVAFSGQAWAA